MRTVFRFAQYLVLVAVVGLLLAGAAALVFGGITTVTVIARAFAEAAFNAEGARAFSLELIELIDVFLLATVILITAVGLYQLFIDPEIPLPEWLSVNGLDQLKANVVAVIVVMVAILFLGAVAGHRGEEAGMLQLGAGIGLVFAGLAVVILAFLRVEQNKIARWERRRAEPHVETDDRTT